MQREHQPTTRDRANSYPFRQQDTWVAAIDKQPTLVQHVFVPRWPDGSTYGHESAQSTSFENSTTSDPSERKFAM